MEFDSRFWAVVPVIAATDVKKSAEYYRDVLGFKIDETFVGDDFAMLWADQCQLFVTLNPTAVETAEGQQIMICAPAIDELYELHSKNQADIISDIDDKPWGLREYTVKDPSGYYLRFQAHIETQYKPWKDWKEKQGRKPS